MNAEDLTIEYSDRDMTPWGGMKLMKDLVDGTGIKAALRKLDLPQPGSNRGYGEQEDAKVGYNPQKRGRASSADGVHGRDAHGG